MVAINVCFGVFLVDICVIKIAVIRPIMEHNLNNYKTKPSNLIRGIPVIRIQWTRSFRHCLATGLTLLSFELKFCYSFSICKKIVTGQGDSVALAKNKG
jgi:hypothetical protein